MNNLQEEVTSVFAEVMHQLLYWKNVIVSM